MANNIMPYLLYRLLIFTFILGWGEDRDYYNEWGDGCICCIRDVVEVNFFGK